MLTKEDTSHGFPFYRPMERNSDWALYNINSEGWFQAWSVILGIIVVSMWFWIADAHFNCSSTGDEDEDILRFKDAKATTTWERCLWGFTYFIHGQHMAAFMRDVKFYVFDADCPQLNVRKSYNTRNPYATD